METRQRPHVRNATSNVITALVLLRVNAAHATPSISSYLHHVSMTAQMHTIKKLIYVYAWPALRAARLAWTLGLPPVILVWMATIY